MYMSIRIALVAVALASTVVAQTAKFEPHKYRSASGTELDAELGEFNVPENRSKAGSKPITLRFVRFKSTSPNPGHPIVYLAGGPGGSGIEAVRGSRFALVMGLREFGDVIAYDQRGINRSGPDMTCKEEYVIPPNEPLDRAKAGPIAAAAAKKCVDRLRASGVDVGAYNTIEGAADLDDLRKALGAKKLVLWGISYGTHLSIATLRYHPDAVDRVILAGIEGPDDTYKLPSDQQTLMEEIARRISLDPKLREQVPDFLGTVNAVLRELEREPKTVSLTHPVNGMTANVTVGKFDFQQVLAGMLFAPSTYASIADFVTRVSRGDWTALALAAAPTRFGTAPSAMSMAMDCASGISDARRRRIAEEAPRTHLGDAINAPFPELCAGLGIPDVGNAFRAPLRSNVPALLISGTMDGRTRPRQAEELRMTMPNAVHLVIDGAGHSDPLFLSSPKILEAMKTFMRGETLRERTIELPPLTWVPVRAVGKVSDAVLARYAGTYRIDDKNTRRVVKAGSILYTVREGAQPFAIRPTSETEFFYENTPSTLRFEVDPQGKVVAMVFRGPDGVEQRAVREN